MKEETFADYILGKEDWGKKLEVMYYLKRKTNIYLLLLWSNWECF